MNCTRETGGRTGAFDRKVDNIVDESKPTATSTVSKEKGTVMSKLVKMALSAPFTT